MGPQLRRLNPMRRAVLIFNPNSGRRTAYRLQTIGRVAAALRERGLEVTLIATEGPRTAGRQAAAIADTAETVFACGGDGTIHEVLQGLAFHPRVALGIIPLGSANALARHLGLSLDPVRAAIQQLAFTPILIPIGKIIFSTTEGGQSRYFIVMAGADGALVYRMLAADKNRLGRLLYYVRAAKLFCSTRFSPFTVTTPLGSQLAVSAMAVRIADLGGLFSPLVRGSSLEDPHVSLSLARPPAHLSLTAWFAISWARLHRWNRCAQTLRVDSFSCGEGHTKPVQVQADGEWLGRTPMSVQLVPNAIRLLMPSRVS
jgi:diacylglycerol kinase (ATP)